MTITYEATKLHNTTTVKLDGKRVGFIRQDENGYAYYPVSTPKKGGDYFPTLAACKRSIEGTDEDAQGFDDMSVTRVVVAGEPIVTVGMMREAQADSMPWCEPCGSYHHATAPGCRAQETITYEVIVGNIGTVYSGTSEDAALSDFYIYRHKSKQDVGRASGEDVTLMRNGEPWKEYSSDNRPVDEDGEYID
jgi:hypothetical protein